MFCITYVDYFFFTVVVLKKVGDFFQDNFRLKNPFSIWKNPEVVNVNLNQDLGGFQLLYLIKNGA